MGNLWQPFVDNAFMRDALWAGVLVSILCAFIGTFVVLRGMAFVGDALAHGVLPGIAFAALAGVSTVAGAAVGALVMMGGIRVVQARTRLSADTAIGLLFVGMLSLGVIITSRSDSFTGDLTSVLFGQLLGVTRERLAWLAVATVAVAAVVVLLRRPFLLLCIDDDLADTSGFRSSLYNTAMLGLIGVAVVASFQTVGTLLVFGMLLAPAATAALVTRRIGSMIAVSAAVGSASTWLGLLLSYHHDLAAGATVVVVAVTVFVVTLLVRGGASGFMSAHPSHAAHPHPGHGH